MMRGPDRGKRPSSCGSDASPLPPPFRASVRQALREAWHHGLATCIGECSFCTQMLRTRRGRPNKLLLIVLGSRRLIEERPFQIILLLGLSPSPWAITSYVLGTKVHKLSVLKFIVPMTLSGVKLVLPIYAGSRMSMLSGDIDPTDLIFTLVSIAFGIILFTLLARYALWKLEKELAEKEAVAAPQPDLEPGVDEEAPPADAATAASAAAAAALPPVADVIVQPKFVCL
mmetsp:Transcript_101495/g.326184  ORF Transcript_101495/g.326184 Transcript_101495/m.326184 type:complete len:229 (-) Transcript_101495:48-734(-)